MAKFCKSDIHQICEDVRTDGSDLNWASFVYDGKDIVHGKSGIEYDELEEFVSANDDRVYIFVRVRMGDEMSKRMKFAFITYYGSSVSPISKAKCSTDKQAIKAAMPDVAQDFLMDGSIDWKEIKDGLKKAGGANYDAQAS